MVFLAVVTRGRESVSDVAADPICQSPRGGGGTVLGFEGDGEDRKTGTRLWSEVSHLSFPSRSIWPDVRAGETVFGVEGSGWQSSAVSAPPPKKCSQSWTRVNDDCVKCRRGRQ